MPDPSSRPQPRLDPVGREQREPSAVVLVLHGGKSHSHESADRRTLLTYLRMLPFARMLSRAGRADGLGVYLLRYRYRGWNGPDMDALRDAQWALRDLARRFPDVPVVLLGHSMGGRAALHAAGAENVAAVCALAPWLDGTDPVEQLAGRTVLIAHGDRERMTDPRQSYAYAVRAKRVTARTCRFDVLGDGHSMLRRTCDWNALVRAFVLGELGIEPEDPSIANALGQPAPGGLHAALTGATR